MCDILGYEGEWAVMIAAWRDWLSERTRVWQCLGVLEQIYWNNNECVVDGSTDDEYLYTSLAILADAGLRDRWNFGQD